METLNGRRLSRIAALALGTMVALLLLAGPASAHGRGSDATNFDSRIVDTPDVPGVTWRIHGGDEYLSVTNAGDAEIVVLGYDGEPYLRVGPDGVWRNTHSPATYVNQDRYTASTLDPRADPDAEPDWEQISGDSSYYWHDHRMHWMAPVLPPLVREGPAESQLVQPWTVPFVVDGQELELTGELWWVPGPSPWPWIGLGLVLSLPALAGLRIRGGNGSFTQLARPAAAVLGAVALLNVIHLVDDLLAGPAPLPDMALAAVQTALFLAVGIFGAVRGWQAGEGAFTALGVGSGALLIGQGILYAPVLGSSQLTSVFPDVLARLAIGWSIAQALPVGIVAVIGTRRMMPEEPAEPTEAQPAQL